jgi:hypothetical protein
MATRKPIEPKRAAAAGRASNPKGKVYRSVAEIRRSFYPKAGSERSRESTRVGNDVVGRTSKPGGALHA